MITRVIITKYADKQMRQSPQHIRDKLLDWRKEVELFGIQTVRQTKGYHDEPLKGKRIGERSIRLNKPMASILLRKEKWNYRDLCFGGNAT